MPDTIWDAAMAFIAARLAAAITDVPIDLDRRAPVAEDECPRLTLRLGQLSEDLAASPGEAFHGIEIILAGFVTAASDTACRIAVNTLLARAVAALNGAQSGVIFDVAAGAERRVTLYEAEESAKAMGEFTQSFIVSAVTPVGSPYAP